MSWDGVERRMGSDERLGYIEAKLESVQNEVSEFKSTHKEHCDREEKDREKILEKLDLIKGRQDELLVYKRVFQTLVALVVLLLSLNLEGFWKALKGLF